MSAKTLKENKMGVMPVGKLMVNMALPMIISMLVQALYNVVDSVFVARLSQNEADDRGDLFRLDGGRGVSLQNGVCRKVCV